MGAPVTLSSPFLLCHHHLLTCLWPHALPVQPKLSKASEWLRWQRLPAPFAVPRFLSLKTFSNWVVTKQQLNSRNTDGKRGSTQRLPSQTHVASKFGAETLFYEDTRSTDSTQRPHSPIPLTRVANRLKTVCTPWTQVASELTEPVPLLLLGHGFHAWHFFPPNVAGTSSFKFTPRQRSLRVSPVASFFSLGIPLEFSSGWF